MINWQYFFGSSGGKSFARYYKAEINGARVERLDTNRGRWYSLGNIDNAKKKYKTQEELINALNKKP